MLLKKAIQIYRKPDNKLDILEILGINVKYDYFNESFYKEKLQNLPTGKYFLSDLDGTFFRGALIKEAFTLFAKYLSSLDITKVNIKDYKEFLDDYKFFKRLEVLAYNKQIDYSDYLNAGLFLIYKHHHQVKWTDFLLYLKDHFYRLQKLNPFRFSMKKLKEILEQDVYFLFISGSSNFVFDIYLNLLKEYVGNLFGLDFASKIFGFCAYVNLNEKYIYNLHTREQKSNFISQLKNFNFFEDILGGMGDTLGDYGIADHLPKGRKFYFINPVYSVIKEHSKYKKSDIKYSFIFERKDLVFEFDISNINLIDLV